MYPHRHGFCSFSFAQHNADGGEDDVIACAHGLSCIGEHVTASAAGARITRRTAAMAKMETHVALIITIFLLLLLLLFVLKVYGSVFWYLWFLICASLPFYRAGK